jgi:FkbM family methyltransferase
VIHKLGWWFANGDRRMIDVMASSPDPVLGDGRRSWKTDLLKAVLPLARGKRRALDVGAHVGCITYPLAHLFNHVDAFEPIEDNRVCFHVNLGSAPNVSLHPVVLSNTYGRCAMAQPTTDAADSYVVDDQGNIPKMQLDAGRPLLDDIDFIKVSANGYELLVLAGGVETIKLNRPVIAVEQRPALSSRYGYPDGSALDFLRRVCGYTLAHTDGDWSVAVPTQ